jgi:hypothetical protein
MRNLSMLISDFFFFYLFSFLFLLHFNLLTQECFFFHFFFYFFGFWWIWLVEFVQRDLWSFGLFGIPICWVRPPPPLTVLRAVLSCRLDTNIIAQVNFYFFFFQTEGKFQLWGWIERGRQTNNNQKNMSILFFSPIFYAGCVFFSDTIFLPLLFFFKFNLCRFYQA